ncbi:metallophosphoesterase [Hahella sp. CR1]|uniref:metallophosphoesterase family protein n=1 Tax=Hahella sp. CR1 TaxID=2992807 RepID=UPI002442533C|nr:metallophosphoesterase [Hahella sp. CR1]MDG9672333.1 metallophosphoesterase [Hahella sp. CR1]
MAATLLLRFRDLSCPTDETIKRHRKIIEEKGYVWWGWWNKGHEKIPLETIRALGLNGARAHEVYLFDSAQHKFYKAGLTEISQDLGESIPSPDSEFTPDYYIDNTHQAWFKFDSIVNIKENEVVTNMAYESMDDLFTDSSNYTVYNNKIVASSQELSEQNRTIWKIREKTDYDKTNEILLRDRAELQPRNFDEVYRPTNKKCILWLSDLHFTNEKYHGFPLNDSDPNNAHLGKVINRAYFPNDNNDIATLLISGDMTWKGVVEEYELVSKFIEYICSLNSLDKAWISLCPGNHDLSFFNGAGVKEVVSDEIIGANARASREAYESFYKKYFYIKPNESMTSGRRFLLGNSIPVEIVMLNSVTLQQTKESFQGHGFIGNEQLDEVTKSMRFGDKKPRNVVRICVMHHHLIPVSFSQDAYHNAKYSTVLDAERLCRWLTKYEFDFLLHGHMHQNFCCTLERSEVTHICDKKRNRLHILSLGSTGVCASHTGESSGNWACKIIFGQDNIVFEYAKITPLNSDLTEKYSLEFSYNE